MSEKIEDKVYNGSLFPEARLLIQETKRLNNGIFVWKTKLGLIFTRMLDFDTILRFKGRFIWEIITADEMRKLGFDNETVAVQEAYLQEQIGKRKPYVVQESVESESEQDRLARIRKESEDFMAKQKKENAEKDDGKQVVIQLIGSQPKNDRVEPVEMTEREKAWIKNEDVKEKLIEDYASEGIKLEPEEITERNFQNLIDNLKTIRERGKKPPSGSIPLEGQTFRESTDLEFETYPEMIDFLRDAENSTDKEKQKEAHEILEKLYLKMLESQENTGKPYKSHEEKDMPLVEQINEMNKRRRKRD